MRWDSGGLGPFHGITSKVTVLGPEPESLVATLVVCGVSPILRMVNCSQEDKGQLWFLVSKSWAGSSPAWWLQSKPSYLLRPLG